MAINGREGRLAQLVERLLYTQDVGGSSPSPPTNLRCEAAQVVRRSFSEGGRMKLLPNKKTQARSSRSAPAAISPEDPA
jgi:hypothetical protein